MRKIAQRWPATKTRSLLLAAALSSCLGPRLPIAPRGEQVLGVRGLVEGGPFALGRADLAGLPRSAFLGLDPATGREARYEGVALGLLVTDRVERQPGVDTVVVESADVLRLPLPVTLARERQVLLADRIDGAEAPLQLAWPNRAQPGLDRDPRGALAWAHGVVALDLVRWRATWGRALAAPVGSSDQARRGAGQYGLRCSPCHALHGVGGRRGPALDGAPGRLGLEPFLVAVRAHPGWTALLGAELTPDAEVLGELTAFLGAAEVAGEPAPQEPLSRERAGRRP